MEQTGLSFLVNLTGKSGNADAADATTGSDPADVNAFFTLFAGLASEGPASEVNSVSHVALPKANSIQRQFDAAFSDFEIDDVALSGVQPAESVGASDGLMTAIANLNADEEANLVGQAFDRGLRAAGLSNEDIERIDHPANATGETLSFDRMQSGVLIEKSTGQLTSLADMPEELIDTVHPIGAAISGAPTNGATQQQNPIEASTAYVFDRTAVMASESPVAGGIAIEGAITQSPNQSVEVEAVEQSLFVAEKAPIDVAALASADPARTHQAPAIEHMSANAAPSSTTQATPPTAMQTVQTAAQLAQKTAENSIAGSLPASDVEASTELPPIYDAKPEKAQMEQRSIVGANSGSTAASTNHLVQTAMPAIAAPSLSFQAGEESEAPVPIGTAAISSSGATGDAASIQIASPAQANSGAAAWAQVVSAISDRNGEAKLELRLNPPELGRVVIGFESLGDDIVRAVVSAESQQTLDLMRRNLDVLERELLRSGLGHVDVELADREQQSQTQDADDRTIAYARSGDAAALKEESAALEIRGVDGRLDLRV